MYTYKSLGTSNTIITRHCSSSSEVDVNEKKSHDRDFFVSAETQHGASHKRHTYAFVRRVEQVRSTWTVSYSYTQLGWIIFSCDYFFSLSNRENEPRCDEMNSVGLSMKSTYSVSMVASSRVPTNTYTHIISCTQNGYRVDYFIFHFRKTKIGSS